LEAPEQPEALLVAKLPEVEEIIVDEAAQGITADVDASVETETGNGEDNISDLITEELPLSEEISELTSTKEKEDEEAVQTADFIPEPIEPIVEEEPIAEPVPLFTPEPTPPETATSTSSTLLSSSMQDVPHQPPINWEAKARRRGCFTTLLGATFGAILGAVLTLAILAALNNGSLNYAAPNAQIQQQLETEIISRTNELNNLSTRVSVVATTEAEANRSLQTDFEAANEEITNNEEIISTLATRSGALEVRLRDVAGAADTFNNFLDGLSALLIELDAEPSTPIPGSDDLTQTPSPTPTPLSLTTPLPPPTTAVQPTRTPQPTATPFTFPTNTPAPQP
jgi:cell division septation protein DedD